MGEALSNWEDREDRPHEECGVFGIYAPGEDVARITFFGLYALQHRGQESAGIATVGGNGQVGIHRRMGLVAQVFDEDDLLGLQGDMAVGHTRYSTTGSSRIENAQPLVMESALGPFALAHNGNLTNTAALRKRLLDAGETLDSSSDSEILAKLLARAPGSTWIQKIRRTMRDLSGAYSLVVGTTNGLYGIRDPQGVRPLCIGRLGEHWVIASESCAIDTVGGELLREVAPGEVVMIDGVGEEGMRHTVGQVSVKSAMCLFEYIYFARPDSIINGRSLYLARQRMGAELAKEYQVEADLVIGVPDSATPAAVGYANARQLPYTDGLIKNRYIGRTFIQPDQHLRQLGVKLKFNALAAVLEGKRVIVIDDSIVRGTTIRPLVELLRRSGAREVHLGITSPPFRHPCYLGVDLAQYSELIAARLPSVERIAEEVGVDSLHYLSLDGLVRAIDLPPEAFCSGCFTGHYPVPVDEATTKLALEGSGV
ncbi:MAG TPA: amidophosphoribosyltransferase [Ktedonobacterales bacterium]|nr:amidophosphoribosyltransferase [Ktedonobacterales bacterium]